VSELADLTLENHSGQPVARLRGEVDASNADSIRQRIDAFVSNHELVLVVDLSDVHYVDRAGVRMLFDLAGGLERRQLTLHLVVGDGTHVAQVFRLVSIDKVATLHPTLGAAFEELTGEARGR
jgi:anti-anti-sigma factor